MLLSYSLLKKTGTAIVVHYKNMKAMVRSLDGDTDFFDIIAVVFKISTISVYNLPNLLITNVNGSHKRKWFYIHRQESDGIPQKL